MIRIREQEMTWMASLIYVVEDDQNIREIESFALKNSGYMDILLSLLTAVKHFLTKCITRFRILYCWI